MNNNIPAVPKPSIPAFIDKVIVQLQDILKANLPWLDYSFGRAQKLSTVRNEKPYTYPAVHIGKGEYLNVFPDDTLGNFTFFIVEDPQVIIPSVPRLQNSLKVRYSLIVWCDLNSIFGMSVDRNSEAIKEQVVEVMTKKTFLNFGGVTVDAIHEQAEAIYRDYNIRTLNRGYDTKELQSQFLMQPYYGLRLDGELSLTETCTGAIAEYGGLAYLKDALISPVTVNVSVSPFTYEVPSGMLLDQISITTDVTQNMIIELDPNAEDIFNSVLDSNEAIVFVINKRKKTGVLPVYFRGFTAPFVVKFYFK